MAPVTWSTLETLHVNLNPGGQWKPHDCVSRDRVAILVPYRDRESHLRVLLHQLHPFLQNQKLDYGIYIIEQDPEYEFNRGLLLNIGFLVANASYPYQCHVFHDVDHIPEHGYNQYGCPDADVRHMAVAVDKFQYKALYGAYVGGVLAIRTEAFIAVNGYSNNYFGWGAEDDDFFNRLRKAGMVIERPSADIGRYTTVPHSQAPKAMDRLKYLRVSEKVQARDGLGNVNFVGVHVEKRPLYTWVYATVDKNLVRNQTEDIVSREFQLWKEEQLLKQEQKDMEEKLRGNFKDMPQRGGPVVMDFADIPLQKFELEN